MIFAGDAAYTYENLERLIVGGSTWTRRPRSSRCGG